MKYHLKKLTYFLILTLLFAPFFHAKDASAKISINWFNGTYQNNEIWDYTTDLTHPNYGTHDWIANHAMNMLPSYERTWIQNNFNAFLLGTEAPDNAGLDYLGTNTGYGDFANHVVHFSSDGSVTNDAAAQRASQEYNKAATALPWDERLGAYYAGAMVHYISDQAVFGHVMGGSSFLPGATHHADYERGVEAYTYQYNGGAFEKYLITPNILSEATAYDSAIQVARVTTFGYGKTRPALWMEQNIPTLGNSWNVSTNAAFTDSAGDSLYRSVVACAKVLHTLAIDAGYVMERIPQGGTSRYDTAVGISKKVYPTNGTASSVVLVSGNSYIDAIAAGPFAKTKNGVVLFTDTATIPSVTLSEIQRLLPNNASSKIYVVGGTSVISPSVDSYLSSHYSYTITRLGTVNRYDTSAQLASNMPTSASVFLTQTNAIDGIAAGAVGARDGIPILITKPDVLSSEINDFLSLDPKGEAVTTVYILGGTGAVSSTVADQITSLGKTVVRIAGASDRFDTARLIADTFYSNPSKLALANGYSMVDAVAGSVLAGRSSMPVLLTSSNPLPATTQDYIQDNAGTLTRGYIFGGTNAVSYSTERAAGVKM